MLAWGTHVRLEDLRIYSRRSPKIKMHIDWWQRPQRCLCSCRGNSGQLVVSCTRQGGWKLYHHSSQNWNQNPVSNTKHKRRQSHAPCHHHLILPPRIVHHVARRVAISTRVINARWSNIVTQHVKRNIDQSIKKSARDELQSYTMKNYSKSIHLVKIVQYAF